MPGHDKFGALQKSLRTAAVASLKEASHAADLGRRLPAILGDRPPKA
jgi:hypothetical protein